MSAFDTDWRAESRAEMFSRAIVAVDCARADAEEHGDERYMRYCDEVLFPFLEAEKKSAQRVPEGGGEVVRLRLVQTDAGRS